MSGRDRRLKIVFTGYGGQGVLTASQILGRAAAQAGSEVMVGQLHGMSQRGGSVESTVVIGPGRSAHVADGEADVVLGFEPLETLRSLPRMSGRTLVLMNIDRCTPAGLAQSGEPYPELDGILERIRQVAGSVQVVDGPEIVREAGLVRTLNVAMLGALSGTGVLPFDEQALWQAVERKSPPHFLEPNRRAFELGRQAACAWESRR